MVQACLEDGGKLPRTPQHLGVPPSFKNIKYTRMRHFQKKNSKISSPIKPYENVSPGPAVALDGRIGCVYSFIFICYNMKTMLRKLKTILEI